MKKTLFVGCTLLSMLSFAQTKVGLSAGAGAGLFDRENFESDLSFTYMINGFIEHQINNWSYRLGAGFSRPGYSNETTYRDAQGNTLSTNRVFIGFNDLNVDAGVRRTLWSNSWFAGGGIQYRYSSQYSVRWDKQDENFLEGDYDIDPAIHNGAAYLEFGYLYDLRNGLTLGGSIRHTSNIFSANANNTPAYSGAHYAMLCAELSYTL